MATKLLLYNPYRILGVYSNSPKKDMLSNINKMKAFLKVGKTISFPLDLPAFLPPLSRDEYAVSSAQTAIELPMDQIKHTLFWFNNSTSFDNIAMNHLLSGNIIQAKEIWNKKESVSSLINLMVCSMIEEDWETLALNADTLFQKYPNELCLAVNETIKLTSCQLIELFIGQLKKDRSFDIAKLMQVSGISSEWRQIAGSGLVKPIIDNITLAIAEAKEAKGAIANYIAGEKLINSTKGLLAQLRGLLGVSDMEYQMIADKLATTILQCGINYFNEIEEDDALEKTMKLQDYALSIAVGQMAKDRCKENVNILKKIGPEYKAQKEINRIGERLKRFSYKPAGRDAVFASLLGNGKTFSDIDQFIDDCKSDLLLVRQKLGVTNVLYINISSAVASAAINALVEKINAAQQMANITSDRDSIKNDVSSAISTMSKISSLDMSNECRNYFNKNNSTLNSINSQLNPSGGCYIATMVYGDYNHPKVMVLRQFRDLYLSQRSWGKRFIIFYYANSPHWVEILKDHKRINTLIKVTLNSFVYFLKKTSHYE